MSVNLNKIVADALRRNKSGYAARQLRKVFAGAAALTFPETSACRRGCSACCWTMPMTYSTIEQTAILQYVKENTNSSRQCLKHVPLQKMLEYHTMVVRDTGHAAWSEAFRAEWEVANLPCPALILPDGWCLIYEVRPLECHLRQNPEECLRPYYNGSPWAGAVVPPLLLAASAHNAHDYALAEHPSREPLPVLKASRTLREIVNVCLQMDTRLFGTNGSAQPLAQTLSDALST